MRLRPLRLTWTVVLAVATAVVVGCTEAPPGTPTAAPTESQKLTTKQVKEITRKKQTFENRKKLAPGID